MCRSNIGLNNIYAIAYEVKKATETSYMKKAIYYSPIRNTK